MRRRMTCLLFLLIALPCLALAVPPAKPAAASPAAAKPAPKPAQSMPTQMEAPPTMSTTASVLNKVEGMTAQLTDETVSETKKLTDETEAETAKLTAETVSAVEPSDPDAFKELVDGPNPTAGPPSSSIKQNEEGADTMGLIPMVMRFAHPLNNLMYLSIDSYLRNMKHVALPCTITSWVPLEGTCTPLKS